MTLYGQHVNRTATPQTERAREDQVANNAGGFVFAVSKWQRLDRFLILGAEGGTYYVDEKKLVRENAKAVDECLREDGLRTVRRIVEISDQGRAPKNDPAIFALAMAAGSTNPVTRKAALDALPKVCRIGTHLFHFAGDSPSFRAGWGRSLRTAVSKWYTMKGADQIAFQAVKYQQRDGWSHRDLLRLSHPKAPSAAHEATFRWMTGGIEALDKPSKHGKVLGLTDLPAVILAFEEIKTASVARAIELIRVHRLPHECVPNEMKGRPEIWEALLPSMGTTAIIRNLAKMTSIGLIGPMSKASSSISKSLTDPGLLSAGRIHPLAVLFALKTYESGHGLKGSLTWEPSREILDALDEAFYLSFKTIQPTGKRHLLALDVSGSMGGATISGTSLTARDASAAMAMVTARSEENWHCFGFSNRFVPLHISPKQRLDDTIRTISNLPFDGTDCSLPMQYAMKNKIEVDTFVVYTDNETYAGTPHPYQALRDYRNKMGIPAKLIVVGMTSTEFTIADPSDAGMMDIVGFDAAAPGLMADFSRDAVDTGEKSS